MIKYDVLNFCGNNEKCTNKFEVVLSRNTMFVMFIWIVCHYLDICNLVRLQNPP